MAIQYSDLITDRAVERSWLKDIAVVVGASIIIALFAHISIPLPFTPVPIATQGHVILLLAALLGAKRASLAVLTFLFQGAIGLPVFAMGKAGLLVLAGPRGGYLLGYLAAAFVTGYCIERMANRSTPKIFAALSLGNLMMYVFGLPWLSRFVGWESAFTLGFLPFIIGDAFKLIAATKVYCSRSKSVNLPASDSQ